MPRASIARDGSIRPAWRSCPACTSPWIERPARLEVKSPWGTYGANFDVAPVFFADDPRATVLGRLADGRAGLVRRDGGGWTTVYSSAPKLPAALLRELAAQAGVHCYLRKPQPHDVIYANRSLVALCVSEPGPRTVVLPRALRRLRSV